MKTLTAAQARQSLDSSRPRAIRGEVEVGALRPAKIYSKAYALQEYGVTAAELGRAEVKIGKQLTREKARGWDGTPEGLGT